MILSFDHLVHYVSDPQEAIQTMKGLGFHAVKGGRHEKWGTYNALAYFGLSYIEWIGIEDERIARLSENDLIRHVYQEKDKGEHILRFALRTNDMDELVARLTSHPDIKLDGPHAGSRLRSDGQLIQWRMLFVQSPYASRDRLVQPFFIEWGQDDEQRYVDLQKNGIIAPHPNGVQRIQALNIEVESIEQTMALWRKLVRAEDIHLATGNETEQHQQTTGYRVRLEGIDLYFYERVEHTQAVRRSEQRSVVLQLAGRPEQNMHTVHGAQYFF